MMLSSYPSISTSQRTISESIFFELLPSLGFVSLTYSGWLSTSMFCVTLLIPELVHVLSW